MHIHLHLNQPVHFHVANMNVHYPADGSIKESLNSILNKQNKIIMDQAELAAEIKAVKDQNEKAKTEILGKIGTLESLVGKTSPEVDAALADLKTSVQGTDDIVPDEVVE